jgi:hypothetical protein
MSGSGRFGLRVSSRAPGAPSSSLGRIVGLLLLLPAVFVGWLLGFALLAVFLLIGTIAAIAFGIWVWRYRLRRAAEAPVIEGEFVVVPEKRIGSANPDPGRDPTDR